MTVSTMRARLNEDDIKRLVRAEDPDDRAASAHKICRRIADGTLDESDRAAARQIMDYIMADAAETVRRALAVTLKNSPHLPHDVALKLIEDAESIAAPVLEFSPVLTDEDLIRVVKAGVETRQVCIAKRRTLTSRVVRVIAERGAERAVAAAAANDGAQFDRASYASALRRWGKSVAVTEGFIARSHIPVDVAEKMVALVSDEALKRLAGRHELPPQLAVELSEGARERATIDLIDQAECSSDLQRFVQQLNLNGRLTPSLVVRSACAGAMSLFEHCVAELAGVPHQKAWILIHDAGPLGLRAVFDRTGLPERIFPALRTALDVFHETDMGSAPDARARFSKRITQRILTQRQSFAPEDLDYLLERLDAHPQAAPATVASRAA